MWSIDCEEELFRSDIGSVNGADQSLTFFSRRCEIFLIKSIVCYWSRIEILLFIEVKFQFVHTVSDFFSDNLKGAKILNAL